MAFTPSILILISGRFIVGIGVGVAAMVVPIYLAEVAPKQIRGMIVNFNVIMITGGQFLSLLICLSLGNKWRWMLGLAAIPSILQAIGMIFLYETPIWLFKSGQEEKATIALRKMYSESKSFLTPLILDLKLESERCEETPISYLSKLKSLFCNYKP
mmetsp:Transcript_15952/g.13928  ORF Transcript_15952/g.13928 Transcript_15952/m.13928 type:complete len:157 (+) Transcript_15952:424-894(+)